MRRTNLFLGLVSILLVACGAASPSGSTGASSLGTCAADIPDCVDVVGEGAGSVTGPEVVVPTGNALNPQPVTDAVFAGASADGTELRFTLWMGVEPCDVIDRVEVVETATAVDVQIMRGVGDPAATCVAMAVERTVVVDLEAPLGDRALTLSGVAVAA